MRYVRARWDKGSTGLTSGSIVLKGARARLRGGVVSRRFVRGMASGAISTDHVVRIAKVIEKVPAVHADSVEVELAELAHQFNPTGWLG
jgi:hypothetical protein